VLVSSQSLKGGISKPDSLFPYVAILGLFHLNLQMQLLSKYIIMHFSCIRRIYFKAIVVFSGVLAPKHAPLRFFHVFNIGQFLVF